MPENGQAQSFTWRGLAGEAASSLAPGIERWLGFLAGPPETPPGATLVKSNLYRSVWKIETGAQSLPGAGGALYFKRYRFPRFSDKLKYTFFETRAEVEWKIARGLAQRGVASLEPLLYAERRTAGVPSEAFFLSREIEGAEPLDRFLEKLDPEKRGILIERIAAFVASMHAKAVHHRDLHQSNLLGLRPLAPQVALVDLHTARLGGEVTHRERVRNLAQLLHSLRPSTSPAERANLLERYRHHAPGVFPDSAKLDKAIERRIDRIEGTRDRSRDKRCLVRSSAYEVSKGLVERIYRRRDWPESGIAQAIERHHQTPALASSAVLKKEGRSLVTKIPWEPHGKGPQGFLCVKEIGPGGLGSLLDEWTRGTRGRRAWAASHALARRGIPAPTAFALREDCFLGLPLRSFLIAEYLEGTQSLLAFFEGTYRDLLREDRRRFLEAFAAFVARIHREGLYHRDFQLRNALVRPASRPHWEFFLIDLESLNPRARLTVPRRIRNLMQLNDCPSALSRTDRLRFFRSYEANLGKSASKEEIRQILVATQSRLDRAARKNERKGH